MSKVKSSKKSTRIDMTAMCDVAFLLLSFFIMTSTARLPEPYPVDTPASTVQTKIPDTNVATITVGEGKVFFGVAGREERILMLQKMADKYHVTFTPEQTEAFSLIDGFGVDVHVLDKLIEMKGSDRNREGLQPGIPFDSVNNQLRDWILCARLAAREIAQNDPNAAPTDGDLNIAIKGDATTQYPTVKKVIAILQDQGKNNFFLITSLRGEDF